MSTFNYALTRLTDEDVLSFFQGEGYTDMDSFVTNEDGSFTIGSSSELSPEDLADIQDTMLGLSVYEANPL